MNANFSQRLYKKKYYMPTEFVKKYFKKLQNSESETKMAMKEALEGTEYAHLGDGSVFKKLLNQMREDNEPTHTTLSRSIANQVKKTGGGEAVTADIGDDFDFLP